MSFGLHSLRDPISFVLGFDGADDAIVEPPLLRASPAHPTALARRNAIWRRPA
jgi:hypothetical protein